MNKLRLGLIGLGFVGKIHILNCLKMESAELVAVADTSKRALKLAKNLGVKKTYDDYTQLLNDKDVDGVIIAVPTHLHLNCAVAAAEAGKHVLLEKPLAKNVKDGKAILSSAENNGVKLMMSYPLRFVPTFQSLKENIENGTLGEIQIANATNIGSGPFMHRAEMSVPRPVPEWWLNKDSTGGGALKDLGCHMINLLHWYFGEVSDVKSYLGYRYNLDIEDHAKCLLKFTNGPVAAVNIGWFAQNVQVSVDLHGTLDGIHVDHKPPSKVKTALQYIFRQTPQYYVPFMSLLSEFVNCIINDSKPVTSGEEALADLETIALAYKNQIHLN